MPNFAAWLSQKVDMSNLENANAAAPVPSIALLWVAIRMAGRGFAEYLSLNWPTRREVLRSFGIIGIVVLAESVIANFIGAQMPVAKSDRVVGGPGGLFILLISASTWLTVMVHSALNTFIFFVKGSYV